MVHIASRRKSDILYSGRKYQPSHGKPTRPVSVMACSWRGGQLASLRMGVEATSPLP